MDTYSIYNAEETEALSVSTTNFFPEMIETFIADRIVLKGYKYITRRGQKVDGFEIHKDALQYLAENEDLEVVFEGCNYYSGDGDISDQLLTAVDGSFDFAVFCEKKKVSIFVAGKDKAQVEAFCDTFMGHYPPPTANADDTVPVSLWANSADRGPQARTRKLNPLIWDEIKNNYHLNTVKQLDILAGITPPVTGGRLILWHGPPGTGKSSAIRMLMRQWLPWCDTSYVVDPESFFGDANYMMKVLMDVKGNQSYMTEDDDEETFVLQKDKRWNLLIVEDADEFLQADAKSRAGQALSRLLNLSDGLLGQGLDFLILITTNERLVNIHPAISRPGRCLANIEFPKLNREDIYRWVGDAARAEQLIVELKKHFGESADGFSLAQLYDVEKDLSHITTNVSTNHLRTGQYL